MRSPFRRKPQPAQLHPGIRIRVSVPNGAILDTDSSHLHYSAMFAGPAACDIDCLPGCDRHGWLNLVPGSPADSIGVPIPGGEYSRVPMKIEIKPIMLAMDA